MSTDLELRAATSLFTAATPDDVIAVATDVANRFSAIVKAQRLFQRIGGRDHVLIEGWQTVGSLVGVFAVKDVGVTQLTWPDLGPLGERPDDPGREPPRSTPAWPQWSEARAALARWEKHRALLDARSEGFAFGFTASFQVVNREGRVIGWGEGQCDRTEDNWTTKPNHQVRSQAQTRGQSRALAAPLRFIVKLAGYATTPADDMTGVAEDMSARIAELEAEVRRLQDEATQSAPTATLDLTGQEQVVNDLERAFGEVDAVRFLTLLERRFPQGVPEPAGVALRAWAWFCAQPANRTGDAVPTTDTGAPA